MFLKDTSEYQIFKTVEHYYQAMKFYTNDPRFDYIRNLENPDDAQLITKTPEYKIGRRIDFDKIKFDVMKEGLQAKFYQNPAAARMLIETGDAILIKDCTSNGFDCYKCGFGIGCGCNMTGKFLMEIRNDLINKQLLKK